MSPERILGKSIFWWMDKLGVLRASRESRVGRYLMTTDPFPGKALELDRLRAQGIRIVGRLVQVDGRSVSFAAGEAADVDAVVWATGYRDDAAWVAIPRPRMRTGSSFIGAACLPCPASTSSGGAGNGREARRCWQGWAMTPPT